jgi:hypothetical protein
VGNGLWNPDSPTREDTKRHPTWHTQPLHDCYAAGISR